MQDPPQFEMTVWPPPPTGTAIPDPVVPVFTRRNAFLVYFLTLLTGGIYYAVWLSKVAARLRTLQPQDAISPAFGIGAIILASLSFVGSIAAGVMKDDTIYQDSRLFSRLVGVILLVFCFQVRYRMNRIVPGGPNGPQRCSGLWTFLIGAAYLQHRLNQTLTGLTLPQRSA